jgi:hypothetical protein
MNRHPSSPRLAFAAIAMVVAVAVASLAGCTCSTDTDLGTRRDAALAADGASPWSAGDRCGNGIDDDGDGRIDDGCPCGAGETQSCFGGALREREVGICSDGTQTCTAAGAEWGDWGAAPCAGDVLPEDELCDGRDHDCDGAVDDGCPCTAGESSPCGVEFLEGECRAGTQTCRADGTWGGCDGAIGPRAEICDNGLDESCDGEVDELCGCTPEPEICRDGADNDCDGTIDELTCTPDWPPVIPPPATCEELADATGEDWTLAASPVHDGTGPGATVEPTRIAIDGAGNVYVLGSVCDGSAEVAGFPVSSHAVVGYPVSTCNPWLVALGPEGALRFGWNPVLADVPVPPPMASGPFAHGYALAPDGAGGVWIVGDFAGVITLAPSRTFTEDTRFPARDAFLVHLDAVGSVVDVVVAGERGTLELFDDVVLGPGSEPIVRGQSSAPIFAIGSTLVRAAEGAFVARIGPGGEPRFVATATPIDGLMILPGRLSLDPDGNVLLPGGSNGSYDFGTTTLSSADASRGHAWLWRISASDGSTIDLRSWQSSAGYYAHFKRARALPGFVGTAGWLRGTIDVAGARLAAGTGTPEEPLTPFVLSMIDGAPPPLARALTTTPYDAFHGVDAHVDWNVCRQTMMVAEGQQGSTGGEPVPPVSQTDFGDGPVMVRESVLQFVQWSEAGALEFRSEQVIGPGSHVVSDVAWSPRDRTVVVGVVTRRGFTGSATVRRYAFR